MGTILAVFSMFAAAALVVLPDGSVLAFVALAAMLSGLGLGGWLEGRPGFIAAATMTGVFATLIAGPFDLTPQQLGSLGRAAARGDATATALIDFFAALEPYRTALLSLVIAAILVFFAFAARRSGRGVCGFLISESEALASLVTRAGILASVLYVPMIIVILYDVGQRQYLDLDPGFTATAWYRLFTSTKLQELEWHLHATLFLMCLAFAYERDAHVRIELVRDGLRPRTRAWIELLGCALFLIPYCFVVTRYGYEFARKSFDIVERSAAQTGLDYRFLIKSVLPLGFLLLAFAGVSVALRCVVFLFGPPPQGPFSGPRAAPHSPDPPALRQPAADARS